jgi:flagellar biosynthesis/type III secretory pathway chaperone
MDVISLFDLLQKEVQYYQAILDITENESRKFTKKRPLEEILPLIKKRKILLKCIEEIHSQLIPLKKEWETLATPPMKKEITKELKKIDKLMSSIFSLDDKNKEQMELYIAKLKDLKKNNLLPK